MVFLTPMTPWRRSVQIPRLLRLVEGPAAVDAALSEFIEGRECRLLFVHAGAKSATGYGALLAQQARDAGRNVAECIAAGNDEATLDRVIGTIDAVPPDFIIGVGGGRVVDVAKLAAAKRGVEFVSIPTQASSDGMCSPVAVMVDREGRYDSRGARIPAGVIVDMAVLRSAPAESWRSGLGDLVSNLSAVRDWRLASETVGEEIDDFACLTAEAAALSVVEEGADLADSDFQQKLIRGLILSGVAMEMAGSSRPASGSEHLISHALDRLLPTPRAHGLQVALGTIAAYLLRGDESERLIAFFRAMKLPVLPLDLGITSEQLLRAIQLGRGTRPGRWTTLDRLSEDDLKRLRSVYEDDVSPALNG